MAPFRTLAVALLMLLPGFVAAAPTTPAPAAAPVLLISMDGFRWDYLAKHPAETPRLHRLADDGVTSAGLVPVFPSNTFPNHYALVTGLYPSHSGMVNNLMFDASTGEPFLYNQSRYARESRWWGGEPIWITAVLQGRKAVCSLWPGSEAEIKGVHATQWKPYDYSIPFERRLDELVGWFQGPPAERPVVATFYLEETNSIGHRFGPESPELAATLRQLDARIGAIVDRFAAAGIPMNYVIVSDHGMLECVPDGVLILDDYLDLKRVQVDFEETNAGLRPAPGEDIEAIVRTLAAMPHAKVYRAEQLPARLHVDPTHPRVPPIWVLPDPGWQIMRRTLYNRLKAHFVRGQHGYDPAIREMHGLFLAQGPAFRRREQIGPVENVQVYNLLCAVAGLKPAPNDGDDRLVKLVMRDVGARR